MLDRAKHRLFCEGVDDMHVIAALLNRCIDAEPFPKEQKQTLIINPASATIGDDGNFDAALREFAAALENQRLERVGLVVDRDTRKHRRVEAIRERLSRIDSLWSGPAPEQRVITGLGDTGVIVHVPDGRRWGIWLMPDNRTDGNLETFIAGLPRTHSDLWAHAVVSTKTAGGMLGAFHAKDVAKAQLHAYLAWMRHPGRPFGDAIRNGHIGISSPSAEAFADWFTRLFLAD